MIYGAVCFFFFALPAVNFISIFIFTIVYRYVQTKYCGNYAVLHLVRDNSFSVVNDKYPSVIFINFFIIVCKLYLFLFC